MLKEYEEFLKDFDSIISQLFENQKKYVKCHKGCSLGCEIGEYPFSQLEMMYIMEGFKKLPVDLRKQIKNNLDNVKNNRHSEHFYYQCPFLHIQDYPLIIQKTHR